MRKLERQSSKRIDIQVGDRIYSLKPLLWRSLWISD
jgi:hypothetical protein